MKFAIDEIRCIDCGACRRYCPVDCIPYRNMQHQVDLDRCIGCTICYAICPADAVVTVADPAERVRPNLSWAAMERVRVRAYRRGPLQLFAVTPPASVTTVAEQALAVGPPISLSPVAHPPFPDPEPPAPSP